MNIVGSCSDYALVGILSIVKNLLSLFQIIAPIACIISLTITFIQLMRNPEEKKLLNRIRNSIVALFVLFFIPVIVNVTFSILGNSTSLSSCWELAENTHVASVYVPIDNRERTSILYDPNHYLSGNHVKVLERLIYYNQNDYPDIAFCSAGNTVAKDGCGAVSFAMIASSYVNSSYNPRVVANWFCSNHYDLTDGGLDEDAVTKKDTLERFGVQGEVLFDKTGSNNYNYGTTYNSVEGSNMLKAVNSGQSVMFGMPGHWSVVGPNISCSSDKFYLYNPSRPTSNGCYSPEELFHYTYNYGNRCKELGWCGWDVAIALSNQE